MKKLKGLLLVLFTMVLAFSFGACSNKSNNSGSNNPEEPATDTRKPSSITCDYTDMKTLYYLGMSIDTSGLLIYVTYDDNSTATVKPGDTGVTVDTTMFVSSTAGTYEIYVYYTFNSVRRYDSFEVEVTDERTSVPMTITAETTEYTLTETASTVNLADIAVTVTLNGSTITAADYTKEYWCGNTQLSSSELVVGAGVYQIWAKVDYYDDLTSTTYEDYGPFVLIYVNDPVVSVVENGTGTYTQEQGSDAISSTWEYTATYSSGKTATISAEDVDVTIDTATVATEATATVSYTEADAKGTTHTATCTVTYAITEKVSEGTTTYTYSYEELTTAIFGEGTQTDKTALKAEYFIGSNAFLTYIGTSSSDVWRNSSNGSNIEIKGEGLTVTFTGTGTITIGFSSNSGTNTSTLGLKDSEGNYITAASYAEGITETTGTKIYYSVTGSGEVLVTFNITEAGTYTICTNLGGEGRVARIKSITMTDIVPTNHTSTYSYEELTTAIFGEGTQTDKTALKAEYFTGSNAFLTYIGTSSSDVWRNSSNGSNIEIKGEGLTVTFTGTGTITIGFSSNSGTNTSTLGLKDSEGNYITAASYAEGITETTGTKIYYSVTGSGEVLVTFNITEAGTYTICTNLGGEGRVARIKSITMTDKY